MIFNLKTEHVNQLLSQPETGMGYQIVEARVNREYTSRRFIALNADVLVAIDNLKDSELRTLTEFYSVTKSQVPFAELSDIHVLSKQEFSGAVNERRSEKSRGAKDNPVEKPHGEEIFVRLSHWDNDKRVDKVNKRLLPGTFSTTETDYKECKRINDDPVERYALPTNDPILWAFYVQPKNSDTLQRGIVQPDFGKRGGGEETYFDKGTSNGTFIKQVSY